MKTLVLIGGLVIALLLAVGVYYVITRVRLAGPDEIPSKPKRRVNRNKASNG